ncbi:MAG TPA: prepilin-type N-terminal cleavage/methylation domain-containing protein [Oculatellaceae cyanobacterium]|jgi:prepilin-type N-terminal cleavage/methylation domain-containing protein
MKSLKSLNASKQGFSLVELTMVIAIVLILAAFAVVSFGNTDEVRDASMVQSAQASLQSLISQGAVRMDKKPYDMAKEDALAILTAIQANVGEGSGKDQGVKFSLAGDRQFGMTIGDKRGAVFEVLQSGDVRLKSLSNFPNYMVDPNNGVIKKR